MFPPGPQKPKEVPPWNTKKFTDAPASKVSRKVLATSAGSRKLFPVKAPQASNQPAPQEGDGGDDTGQPWATGDLGDLERT